MFVCGDTLWRPISNCSSGNLLASVAVDDWTRLRGCGSLVGGMSCIDCWPCLRWLVVGEAEVARETELDFGPAAAAAQPGEAPPLVHGPQNHGRELRRFPRWLAWLLVDGLV